MNVAAAKECDTLLRTAELQLAEGAFEAAVDRCTDAIHQAPATAQAYRGRAVARFQLKRWVAAIEDFRQAHALDPSDRESWLGLGLSLAMEHQIHDALDTLEALLIAHPMYVRGRIQTALLCYRLCLTAKGREQLERALASRPTLVERQQIEQILHEQRALDQRRYYRPDFEALRRQQGGTPIGAFTAWLRRQRSRFLTGATGV